MGLLTIDGRPLTYEESKQHQEFVKRKGVQQFLALLKKYKDTTSSEDFSWGYEIEYQHIHFDEKTEKAKI
jgi:hypothetical protein